MHSAPPEDPTGLAAGQPLRPYGEAVQLAPASRPRMKLKPVRLAVLFGLAVLVFLVLLLAAPGTIALNTTESRQHEGQLMMHGLVDQIRAARTKLPTHTEIRQLTGEVGSGGCGVTQAELAGKYYRVLDRIEVRENGARIYCEPTGKGSSGDPSGHLDFGWQPGDSPILTWQR